jgi:hypothetical protein
MPARDNRYDTHFDVIEYKHNSFSLIWYYFGDGKNGAYDPSNPDDIPFLIFKIYRITGVAMPGASRRTCMPICADLPKLRVAGAYILNQYIESRFSSVILNQLSWIDPSWVVNGTVVVPRHHLYIEPVPTMTIDRTIDVIQFEDRDGG